MLLRTLPVAGALAALVASGFLAAPAEAARLKSLAAALGVEKQVVFADGLLPALPELNLPILSMKRRFVQYVMDVNLPHRQILKKVLKL